MVPAGLEPFGVDAALPAAVEPDQVERDAPQDGQVLSRMSHPHAALIFAEGHVQHPVLRVLNAPMPTHRSGKRADLAVQTTQVVAGLATGVPVERPLAPHQPDPAQVWPGVAIRVEIRDRSAAVVVQ